MAFASETQRIMETGVSESHHQAITEHSAYALSWELLNLALQEMSTEVIAIQAPWSWSVLQLKKAHISAKFFATKTKKREAWAQFTPPITVSKADFFSNSANPISRLADADNQQLIIGVLKNTAHQAILKEHGLKNLYPVLEAMQLVKLLEAGKLSHIFVPTTLVKRYCLKQHKANCLKAGGLNLRLTMYLMGRQDDENFTDFSRELYHQFRTLAKREQVKQLYIKHGLTDQSYQYWLEQLDKYSSEFD